MAGNSQEAAPPRPASRGLGSRLRDTKIKSRLGLILVVPLAATLAFAALRLFDSAGQLVEAETVRSLASVSAQASTVAHQLHQERVSAIRLLGDPQADAAAFSTSVSATDTAIGSYQQARSQVAEVPEAVAARLDIIDDQLSGLDTLRGAVLAERPISASAALLRYRTIAGDLLAYQEQAATVAGDPALSDQSRAVAAWAKAKAHAGDAAAIATLVATVQRVSDEQLAAAAATQTGQQEAFLAFTQTATPDQQAIADQAITGGDVDYRAATSSAIEPAELAAAVRELAGTVDAARWAERQLYDQLARGATAHRDDVFAQVLAESGGVVAALVIALIVAVLLARQLAKSLGRLRAYALKVAEQELPAAVARLSDPAALGTDTPGQLAAKVAQPAALHSRDEIGQVAQSVTVVHRAAVRTAAEQAALRTSVSAMFQNLARRSQGLVDNMIRRLDTMQRQEEDPDRLERIFALDSLATRMRRNDENLLVLAGADTSPPRKDNALIADVLQAAQSEIEHYERVEFGTVDDDVQVVGAAINDVVRLVAELLDNATRYSPPDSAVVCEARRQRDELTITVEDRGLGMTDGEVAAINTWLGRPGELDVTTFRRMGIAVISRLAARHRIHVKLQAHPHHGTAATATLPPGILVLPASRQQAFTLATARRALPVEQAHQPAPPIATPPERQLPRRSGEVVRHTARRGGRAGHQPTPSPPPTAPVAGPASGMPVAGRPAHLTASNHSPQPVPALATVELPIYQQVETAWFRDHGDHGPTWTSSQPQPVTTPTPAPAPTHANTPTTAAPPPAAAGDETAGTWVTAADPGWSAAAAAATPTADGATEGGLPKRVPQAQLVPGSVEVSPAATVPAQRRTPEQVRGLLSAYQRGVQRGRETWT